MRSDQVDEEGMRYVQDSRASTLTKRLRATKAEMGSKAIRLEARHFSLASASAQRHEIDSADVLHLLADPNNPVRDSCAM